MYGRKSMFLKRIMLALVCLSTAAFPQPLRSVEKASCRPLLKFCPNEVSAQEDVIKGYTPPSHYPNFTNNPAINPKMRQLMAPHLLPLDHPMKRVLDSIFSKSRAIENKRSLRQAGFTILFSQKRSFILVAKHPKVPGYLFKIYPDSANIYKDHMVGWELFTTRCAVAKKIGSIIKENKLRYFTVADKWLYPLPIMPKANNVPYTKNGKCAFIDTEYKKRKITLWLVNRFLSKDMSHYWDHLVGKKRHSHKFLLDES
jgi:hypothetical protein